MQRDQKTILVVIVFFPIQRYFETGSLRRSRINGRYEGASSPQSRTHP